MAIIVRLEMWSILLYMANLGARHGQILLHLWKTNSGLLVS